MATARNFFMVSTPSQISPFSAERSGIGQRSRKDINGVVTAKEYGGNDRDGRKIRESGARNSRRASDPLT
jgi:hypothetical protein